MPGREKPSPEPADPVRSAAAAGLHYVEASSPGFTRRRSGKGFAYFDTDSKALRDPDHLQRIRSLVLPPAWSNVWICPLPDGHLQATGFDARGRRQYRYHPRYRALRDEAKFARMTEFAEVLPGLRNRVSSDLDSTGLPRQKVIASVVRLLETTLIRIGNQEYERDNESFGLTTLQNQHVDVTGYTVKFRFKGKSGVDHDLAVKDRRVAKIIQECHELPGYHLFEYVDEDGAVHAITSGDVNAYIKEATGHPFTAKDFRTWAGTVHTALFLAGAGDFNSETEAKRNIVQAICNTASRLRNRPATCRKYYVHPVVTESYLDRTLLSIIGQPNIDLTNPNQVVDGAALLAEEMRVLRLINTFDKSRLLSQPRRARAKAASRDRAA